MASTRSASSGWPSVKPGLRAARLVRPGGVTTRQMILVVALPVAFLAVFFLYPVFEMIGRGLWPDGQLDWAGATEVLDRPRTWRVIGQTLQQATLGTVASVALGIPGAYLLYRTRWRGRGVARALVSVPFVLPTVVVGVAFRALIGENGPLGFLGLDGTLGGILLALVFFNYSVVVRTVGSLWARLDPRTAEAAASLGASPARVFLTVTLPALLPAIASAAALVFLYCATAYGVVLILGGLQFGNVETEIYLQTKSFLDLRAAAVLSIVQILIVAVSLFVTSAASRMSERALTLRSSYAAPLRLRGLGSGFDRLAAATTAFMGAALALPLLYLVIRSLQTPSGWGLTNYENLSTTGGRNALSVTVWEALRNSITTALLATVIAISLGTLISVALSRRVERRTARWFVKGFDAVVMLPLGVSAVTVGFGFLIALDRPPLDLRSSFILVPIAQAMVALPLVVRLVLPVLRSIDPRQREAAAALGAGPWRVFGTVDGPHLARSLGLAAGFAFAISLGEFGATSFLSRPDRATLSVVIYRLIGRPGAENFGMALAACVVLATLTAVVMALAERLRVDGQGAM